jgi:hypothetical protein
MAMGSRKAALNRATRTVPADAPPPAIDPGLWGDIRSLIEDSRNHVARVFNAAMLVTYWSVGDRIRREVLGQERAEYGKRLISRLAEELTLAYGTGFDIELSSHCLDNSTRS